MASAFATMGVGSVSSEGSSAAGSSVAGASSEGPGASSEGAGASTILLVVPVKPGVQAEMVVPGRFRLSPAAVGAMNRVAGVQSVAEG